jgi:hypothetical protein
VGGQKSAREIERMRFRAYETPSLRDSGIVSGYVFRIVWITVSFPSRQKTGERSRTSENKRRLQRKVGKLRTFPKLSEVHACRLRPTKRTGLVIAGQEGARGGGESVAVCGAGPCVDGTVRVAREDAFVAFVW